MGILQVENLSFTYPNSKNKTLDNISFEVESGDFVLVCGRTGCGKTTLLKLLKRELSPHGEKNGVIYYNGEDINNLDDRTAACDIGFVSQRPENQIVTDKVWHELAFGLENMGVPTPVIRRRVGEMSSYFGIGQWFRRDINELSGGQKQLLNLASIMVMQPKILILDEPTSQLDPIAAADFIATLQKLNKEFSLTIIMTEHRMEDVYPIADKVLMLNEGKVSFFNTPSAVTESLNKDEPMADALPCSARLYNKLGVKNVNCPLNIRDGRRFLEENFETGIKKLESKQYEHKKTVALEFRDVFFRYQKDLPDVLSGTSFKVYENEIFCILGGNASGKSTTLSVASGITHPYSGKVLLWDKPLNSYKNGSLYKNNIALLPQDVQTLFLKNTVKEDIAECSDDISTLHIDITPYLDKHPYDLSGGEQQLYALAKVLTQKPKLLMLDEPTKGIDAHEKLKIVRILKELKNARMTIVLVTHDLEFAALCADRCALFFDGDIASCDTPEVFFSENNFYTTSANRLTRFVYENIVTVDDAVKICSLNGLKKKEKEPVTI